MGFRRKADRKFTHIRCKLNGDFQICAKNRKIALNLKNPIYQYKI